MNKNVHKSPRLFVQHVRYTTAHAFWKIRYPGNADTAFALSRADCIKSLVWLSTML